MTKCHGCGKTITEQQREDCQTARIGGLHWHVGCFRKFMSHDRLETEAAASAQLAQEGERRGT